ncbi:MAG TPA: SAM-dependent methyltransferase [Polyangiales bacterium]|nr:SAM-dependent methyltransferase [Polyangiales bacterium]
MKRICFSCVMLAALAGCGKPAASTPSTTPSSAEGIAAPAAFDPAALLAAPDRDPEDVALDAQRHPAEMLRFFEITPGKRVAEIAASRGYTAELLARTVGPTGEVYAQNSPAILERFAQAPWTARLAKPVNARIVRLDREFEDPFPADVKELDVVLDVLFYHDTVWLGTDRARMNKAVFAALRSGGIYGIVDHHAKPGTGLADVETLHRIERDVLVAEVQSAGFELVDEAYFLRNESDTRDWSDSPRVAAERRGTSDRFVLKFVKP